MRIEWKKYRVQLHEIGRSRWRRGIKCQENWLPCFVVPDHDLLYVTGGKARIRLRRGWTELRPGLCVWLRPGHRYQAEQDPNDPSLGQTPQGRVVPDPDQRLMGQPDRGPVRTPAHVRDGQLRPPQPPRPGPQTPGLPTVAQHQRPPPRRPGRPTPRTRPHPQRTPTPLGPTLRPSGVIRHAQSTGRATSPSSAESRSRA